MQRVLIYNNFRLDRNNRMAGMMMKMMNPMGSMPVSQHSIRTQYGGDNHFPSLNKTKYFRLRLSDKVGTERLKRGLRLT